MIFDMFFESKNHPLRIDTHGKENVIVILFRLPIHFHHDLKTCDFYNTVYVKRAFNFRRQCRAAVLSRCLHLARSHCRPLSLSISPLSFRSALERISFVRLKQFLFESVLINTYARRVKKPQSTVVFFAYHSILGL